MVLNGPDVISGTDADIYIIIGNERKHFGHATNVSATVTKRKTAVSPLGTRWDVHKAGRVSGAGTLGTFYVLSEFRKRTIEYANGGADFYFDMEVYNEDPTSRAGRQSTILKNCNLDESLIAYVDSSSDVLEESMPFTFEGAEMPEEFNEIEY